MTLAVILFGAVMFFGAFALNELRYVAKTQHARRLFEREEWE